MDIYEIACSSECVGTVRYLLTKSLDPLHQGRVLWDGTLLTRTCHGEHAWEREHDDLTWEQAMTLGATQEERI